MIIKTNCKDALIKVTGDESEVNESKFMIFAIPKRKVYKTWIEINSDMSYQYGFDLRNFKNGRSLIHLKDFGTQHIVGIIIPSRLRQPKVFVHDDKGQDINKIAKFYYKKLK
ncbi:hypothetical protein [Clostridium peptidivorans]|uniref:hypothetical protein n=1 Tax=Clostridium peptidivorans TaxID=100174 RepID=UPI000BE40EA9|nr:hypothetical protein [Clostridium peptidivorans]